MKIKRLFLVGIISPCLILILASHLWSYGNKVGNPSRQNPQKEAVADQAAPSSAPSNRGLIDKNGIPNEIEGDLSAGLKSKDMTDASFEYFQNHKNMFKIEDAHKEFRIAGVSHDKLVGDYLVRLDQIVNGVPVQFGFYRLNFDQNKKLRKVYGQIDPEARKINTTPNINEEQALAIARKDTLNKDPEAKLIEQDFYIGRFEGELRLLRKLSIMDGVSGKPWRIIIDAHTGKVLEAQFDGF